MPRFFLNKRLLILLVAVVLFVSLVGFTSRDRENASLPELFVYDVVGFASNIISKPVNFVVGLFDGVRDLTSTYEENKSLKEQVEQLGQLQSDVVTLKRENKDLKNQSDVKKTLSEFEPISGLVISRDPDGWFDQVTINKGSLDGIKPNMAVTTGKGLVGKIKSVSAKSSSVELLSSSDSRTRISAAVQLGENKKAYGIVSGYNKEENTIQLTQLPIDQKFKKGQKVVTTGYGGRFPGGLLVGEIESVENDQFGLSQTANIKTEADLYDFDTVLVAKRTIDTES
ncbi:rod shape-determining protein MreC [Brochothrix campestris]|uniref:Cell shape-determining protein MreC n=1 Tax=Brochothrix campestris FSL F6-1037 TaxID=1265861 RepID=W7CTL4_9LIST|nr:rod shape-determining protein MreC [Brochothrix campestris]EUJ39166.1 rod shape-determining protein MreC [Brochothrix campestris FSL F6-1037]